MNDPSEWDDEEDSDASLELDNELLRQKLGLTNETAFFSEDADPYLQNQFLRHIEAFEETDQGPHRVLRTILPEDFTFPPVASMDRAQLKAKLRKIEEILGGHGISLDLAPQLPEAVAYEYIVNEILQESIPLEFPEGFTWHLDGCDGYCPGCFQRAFCDHRIDDWEEDAGHEAQGAGYGGAGSPGGRPGSDR